MDCAVSDQVTMCGNFADVLPKKPEYFDYMGTGKWLETYSYDKRERIGGTVCSCKQIEVHFAPYLGWDIFHTSSCNLMRKVKDQPQLMTLLAYEHLPNIRFSKQAVEASKPVTTYVKVISRKERVKVRVLTERNATLL